MNLSLACKDRLGTFGPLVYSTLALLAVSAGAALYPVWGFWLAASTVHLILVLPHQRRRAQILSQLHHVLQSATQGNIEKRIQHIGRQDQLGEMAWNLNEMLDQVESCMRECITTTQFISRGLFYRRAQPEGLRGMYSLALGGLNSSIDTLEANMKQMNDALCKLAEGDYSGDVDTPMEGHFALNRDHTNNVRSSIANTVETISTTMAAVAKGQLSQHLDAQMPGELNQLKDNVNDSIDQVNRALNAITKSCDAIRHGDLTRRIEGHFEGSFAQCQVNLNSSIISLSQLIEQIKDLAGHVELGAIEISRGNLDLSNRTEAQSSHLEKVAATMVEMTTTTRNTADNADNADSLSQEAKLRAENGAPLSQQAIKAMEAIKSSSKNITEIINVIDEIAFQSNLLALNAAIEAARAGEQGRGFAVVAGEVRALAGRSAEAAKQIKTLIKKSHVSVVEGSQLVNASGEALVDIQTSVQEIAQFMSQIGGSNREQAQDIDLVNQAIMQLDETTQQNSALVEETAAASQALTEQAGQLNVLAGAFRTDSTSAVDDTEAKLLARITAA